MNILGKHCNLRVRTPFYPLFRIGAFMLLAASIPQSAVAQDLTDIPTELQEKINAAREACAEFEGGQLTLESDAIKRIDLDGDGALDWVLDEVRLLCPTAVSAFCGTGGCASHFLVRDSVHSLLNQGWELVDFGPNRALLADVHGAQCGGINPTPCVTASAWDQETNQWRSAAAEWE